METTVLDEFGKYMNALDWTYMITFMILAWMFSRDNALESWWKEDKNGNVKFGLVRKILLWVPKGVRIAVLGFVYGVAHYFILDAEIGRLFLSFIFGVAFHGLILKSFQKKLGK